MNFFAQQEDARRRSKWLIFYFILAVIAIAISVYAVCWIASLYFGNNELQRGIPLTDPSNLTHLWDPELFTTCTLATLALIVLGSLYKTVQLSAGGEAIARDLGGRRIDPDTTHPEERRLLNVVEEMALASGTPVPEVFLLENELAINAFAAGKEPSDAVIGVTLGCLRRLSRSELQGVIAHEFSHILNGDMKLNLRIIGWLHGILLLSIIGQLLMRVGVHSSHGHRRSSKGNNGGLLLLVFGVAIFVIGYIGVFFGHLIKSALSRQREYLADASAVQFTRHPEGLSGALKKIGGMQGRARIQHPMAEEASHLFFSNGIGSSFLNALATHPPLEKRIHALEPSWDGQYLPSEMPDLSVDWPDKRTKAPRDQKQSSQQQPMRRPGRGMRRGHILASGLQENLGNLDTLGESTHIDLPAAQALKSQLNSDWLSSLHHRSGAQAMVLALLLAQDEQLRAQEIQWLEQNTDPTTFEATLHIHQSLHQHPTPLPSARKFGLVDLAIPALRKLDPEEYQRFLTLTEHLIKSDGKVNLFEFTLRHLLKRHLDLYFTRRPSARIRHRNLRGLQDPLSVLLTTLAALGHEEDPASMQKEWQEGLALLQEHDPNLQLQLLPPQACGLDAIERSLEACEAATPLLKKQMLMACAHVILADGKIVDSEAELIRAIADSMGAPLPPILKETT